MNLVHSGMFPADLPRFFLWWGKIIGGSGTPYFTALKSGKNMLISKNIPHHRDFKLFISTKEVQNFVSSEGISTLCPPSVGKLHARKYIVTYITSVGTREGYNCFINV